MNEVLFSILEFVVMFVIGLVTRYVVPWLKLKIDKEKLVQVEEWVKSAVSAAEQVMNKEAMGEEKKAYVISNITNLLKSKGIKLSDTQIDMLIESAVKALNTTKETNS